MGRCSRNFLIIVLCIFIFITGFLLPRYVFGPYLELRQEVRSEDGDSRHSSEENLVPIAEKLSTQNKSEHTVLSNENVKLTEASETLVESIRILATVRRALKYAEIRLQSLFGKSIEDINAVEEAVLSNYGKEIEFGAEIPQDSDTMEFGTEGSGDDPFSQRRREGKFIRLPSFNIFGFGKSLIKTTSESSKEEAVTERETDLDTFVRDELLKTSLSTKTDIFTEDLEKTSDLQSQLFLSQDLGSETEFAEKDSNETEFNSLKQTGQTECLDCVTVDFVLPHAHDEKNVLNNASLDTKNSTRNLFSDEVLRNFCTTLLNKVSESQHLSDVEEIMNSSQNLLRSLNHSDSKLLSSNLSTSEPSNPEPAISEESFSVGMNESEEELSKHSSLLNFEKHTKFKNDKLPIAKESTDTSTKQADVNLENLPSILDCANYFRKKTLKMFPKPNLMDTISDPEIDLTDFANGTISPKLEEIYRQYLADLLNSEFNNSIDIFDRHLKDASKKPDSVEASTLLLESERNVTKGLSFDKEKAIHTENDSDCDDIFAHTESELNLVTAELERDSRFINILGIGSGLRSLDISEFESKGNELGSGDAFKDTADEVRTPIIAEDIYEQFRTASLQEPRFFNFFGLAGSGEGRELGEEQETEIADIVTDCENDCSYGNTTDNISDCGDYECTHDESRDYVNSTELADDHILNESSYEDCDECTMENSNEREENFTEVYEGPPENCSCFHENSDQNITSFECDECDFDIKLPFGETDEFESRASLIPNEESRHTSQESLNKECDNCDEEPDNTHTPVFGQNSSLSECDDCNFSNVNTDDLIEKDEQMFNITCEECNSSVSHELDESYGGFSQIKSVSKENLTKAEDGCLDCSYETGEQHTQANSDFESKNHTSVGTNTVKNIELKEATFRSVDDNEHRETTHSFTETINVIQKPQTTENKRLLGTIFLTGSGDGGLFEESTGPINFVEEESTIVSPDQIPRRGARLDDTLVDFPEMVDEIRSQGFEERHSYQENDTIIVPSTEVSRRRGRLDDLINPCDDCDVDILDTFDGSNIEEMEHRNSSHDGFHSSESLNIFRTNTEVTVKLSEEKTPTTHQNEMAVTVSTSTFSRGFSNFNDLSKLQRRPCTAARECNATLNERCVTINSSRVCDCSRGFARHTKSSICVVKKIVETTISFPREKFEEDLQNNFSLRYKKMTKNSLEMMWLYLKDSPELLSVITEIEVNGFKAGSLIVTYNLIFADINKSQEQLVQHVEKDLQKAISNENLFQNASLNAKGAFLISTNGDIDPCKSSELNYCSANAYCIWNGPLPGRYICLCRKNYNDASANPHYIGETCIAQCSPEYCGSYGHCEILANNEKHCLCSGLYFGRRCEVPGLYVVIILGIVSFITLTVLVVIIFKKRCKRTSYGGARTFQESQETGSHSQIRNKVSDVIAMEETAGATVSRFTSTATPVPPPIIKVIRPTVNESSLSFDYDSSFDTTPNSYKTDEETPTT